ncbi:MAG: Asp-tRNA(Asn)/Glu-tRNA(Gln) amidotransferase subunit GatC [Candidatus Altimarinota bacterium]
MSEQKKPNEAVGDIVTEEQIKHMAVLSRLGLSEAEVKKYAEQMNSILGYMNILNETDTKDTEMTIGMNDLRSVMREDKVEKFEAADQLLDCSVLPKVNNQISVKAVIKEE